MFKGTRPVTPVTVTPSEQAKTTEDDGAASSVRKFTARTTMHGCQSIMQADYHVIRRLMWVTLMLVFAGLFLNAFIGGISRYCSYPSSISEDIQPHKKLSLPDVTVCNNNLIRNSFFDVQSTSIQSFFRNLEDFTPDSTVNSTPYYSFTLKSLDPVEEFISDCTINLSPFDCKEHIQPTLSFTGRNLCYTLSVTQFPLENTTPLAGLRFEISVNESEYSSFYPRGVGLKLVLHQHEEMPDEGLAMNIQPQTEVSVAVKQTQHIRLGTPYSNDDCRTEQHADYKIASLYTKRACEMECYLRYFEEYVGCDYAGKIDGVRDCSLYEPFAYAMEAFNYTTSDKCVCLRPCNETVYSTDVTALTHQDALTSASSPKSVKKIAVEVYYRNFDVNVVTQKPSYRFDSFIADVGGQMGLFLGASILTLSEFVEFLLVYIIHKVKLYT